MLYLQNYLNSLKAERKAENTIIAYGQDIQNMFDFVQKNETDITLSDLINWQVSMDNLSSATVHRRILSVKSYFIYLINVEVISKNPSSKLKAPTIKEKPYDILTNDDVMLLIETTTDLRTKAIIAVYFALGLRVSELINLELSDYLSNGEVVLKTKGEVYKTIIFSTWCREFINKYLQNRKQSECTKLFVSNQGTPMKEHKLLEMFQRLAKKANLNKRINNHSFRHTCVTNLYDIHNGNINIVREIIGHKNIATTQRYIHINQAQINACLESVSLPIRA